MATTFLNFYFSQKNFEIKIFDKHFENFYFAQNCRFRLKIFQLDLNRVFFFILFFKIKA